MKAVKLSGSSGAAIRTTRYSQFKGVDFSTDPMLVDGSRSPYALNLISDMDGSPEKRPGWRVVFDMTSIFPENNGRTRGMWRVNINGVKHFIVHQGHRIYRYDEAAGTMEMLYIIDTTTVNLASRSTAFFMNSKLYIMTGYNYLQYDGETVKEVDAYVPTVVTNRKPSGGGVDLQGYNLIGTKWTEEFVGDGKATEYQLTATDLDEAVVECRIFDGTEWVEKVEDTDFTVARAAGLVTFKQAPPESELVNVKLTPSKTRAGYADKINKGLAAAVYDDQVVFVAGAEKGIDYRSGFGQPDYFSDKGYDRVGTDETDIMGYCKVGEYLGIIKESNSQDNTIYLRWAETLTKYDTAGQSYTERVYKRKQGVVGVGAVSRYAIGLLLDDPLFLSERGMFAISSNAITLERTMQNRSGYVDSRLTKEPNLKDAAAVEWMGYYIVCVNNHCYVMDSRQRSYPKYSNSAFLYECYYWDNIPARVWMADGENLYFGTADGKICKFNTDVEGLTRYSDGGVLGEDGRVTGGEAIKAIWTTKSDDDGHPERRKTTQKKGGCVTLKPFTRSSVKIYVRTEKDPAERLIRTGAMDIFDWEDIDFERFTFNSNDAPQDIMIKHRERKYMRLMYVVVNDAINEGFGIYQIVKCYKVHGGLNKR